MCGLSGSLGAFYGVPAGQIGPSPLGDIASPLPQLGQLGGTCPWPTSATSFLHEGQRTARLVRALPHLGHVAAPSGFFCWSRTSWARVLTNSLPQPGATHRYSSAR